MNRGASAVTPAPSRARLLARTAERLVLVVLAATGAILAAGLVFGGDGEPAERSRGRPVAVPYGSVTLDNVTWLDPAALPMVGMGSGHVHHALRVQVTMTLRNGSSAVVPYSLGDFALDAGGRTLAPVGTGGSTGTLWPMASITLVLAFDLPGRVEDATLRYHPSGAGSSTVAFELTSPRLPSHRHEP